jgi:NADH-quinone oxidoreductase subunit E
MLSDEEKQEIKEEMQNYADPKAVTIDALKIVQRHRGYVSDEALQEVAEFIHVSTADLEGVATFYNLIYRKPVGRHVILACNSVSCWVMGYDRVRAKLKDALGVDLGGTTADNRFTFLPSVCLGICDHAPALMVDQDTYTDLDEAGIETILAKYA